MLAAVALVAALLTAPPTDPLAAANQAFARRQFSQGSADAGKTWSVEYDLIYVTQGTPFAAL
jgi:hypothetical protein